MILVHSSHSDACVSQSKVKKKKGKLALQDIPTSVKGIARMMGDRRVGVDVRTRKYRLKSYKDCFVGKTQLNQAPLLSLFTCDCMG